MKIVLRVYMTKSRGLRLEEHCRRTYTRTEIIAFDKELEMPMPNVMVALPNIGGALC